MGLTKEQGNFVAEKLKELNTVIETMEDDNKKYKYKFKPQPFRRFVRD